MSKRKIPDSPTFPGFTDGSLDPQQPEVKIPNLEEVVDEKDLAMARDGEFKQDELGRPYSMGIGPTGKPVRNYLESARIPTRGEKKTEALSHKGKSGITREFLVPGTGEKIQIHEKEKCPRGRCAQCNYTGYLD